MTDHLPFDHQLHSQRVLFGAGRAAANTTAALTELGCSKPLLITTERGASAAADVTANLDLVATINDAVMHVPLATAEAARITAISTGADSLISAGGGSTTGLAKAIALTTGLPIIAVPTTYAGSEATAVWGITDNRTKHTGTDLRVLPRTIVYDPDLLATLPTRLAIASGLNAMAHCVDSLWAPHADPINRAHALEGARLLRDGLPLLHTNNTPESRELTLAGCYLAALSFSTAGSGLHHKICHILGGTFNLPHADTHAAILPHVLELNASAGVHAHIHRLGELFGTTDPALALNDLYTRINAPTHLTTLGFTESEIPEAVDRILAVAPATNPVAVTKENITSLLYNAL